MWYLIVSIPDLCTLTYFEYSMSVRLLSEQNLEFLSLKGGCTGSSASKLVKTPHCWKLHVTGHIVLLFCTQLTFDLILSPREISTLNFTMPSKVKICLFCLNGQLHAVFVFIASANSQGSGEPAHTHQSIRFLHT